MKKYFYTLLLVSLSLIINAQTTDEKIETIPFPIENKSVTDSTTIFTVVEKMPEFKGGIEELFKFISKNLTYPKDAKDKGVSGVVYANFTIGTKGEVKDVKILRGLGYGLDEEVVRVVKLTDGMWTPGFQRGKPVNVQYNLPIRYTLNDAQKDKTKGKKNKKNNSNQNNSFKD